MPFKVLGKTPHLHQSLALALLATCAGCSVGVAEALDAGQGLEEVPTTCSLAVSPPVGTPTTAFTLDIGSNGLECSLAVDGVEVGSALCNTSNIPLEGLAGGELGSHFASMRVQGGPGGPVTCLQALTLVSPNTSTCAIAIDPEQGTTGTVFGVRFSSNGASCSWALDGAQRGTTPCKGPKLALVASELGGLGTHIVTLNIGTGPGGPAQCQSTLIITTADLTWCTAGVIPATGNQGTPFVLKTATSGAQCRWWLDGQEQGVIACANTGRSLTSADLGGPGAHTIVLKVATGPSGPTQCTTNVTVN